MHAQDVTQIVIQTVKQEQWPLDEAGCLALAEAVRPLLTDESEATASAVARLIANYYHDGPMVEAMRGQDKDGEQLWQEWRVYMVSLANNKGIYGDEADDLAQEVYLQTQRALANFRFGSRLKTYFCGVFLNCYRHWVRSAKRRNTYEEALPVDEQNDGLEERLPWLIDPETQPEEAVVTQVDGGEFATLVHDEITKITKSQDFQILRWYYVEQRFVDEQGNEQKWTDEYIGQRLDMPLNTITSRRLRAVRRLKNHPRLQELFAELTE